MHQLEHIKKSAVIKRSIIINGHKTSVSLEDEFWHGLREIADYDHMTVPKLVEHIDRSRDICNLSSAIRVFVFNRFRASDALAKSATCVEQSERTSN
ncbi:MAG: ribbon-helix-helix domain-containing protein [Pseudolabrys sp.]|jgi:predicted DNA-binding ribbon-helix-helix protein